MLQHNFTTISGRGDGYVIRAVLSGLCLKTQSQRIHSQFLRESVGKDTDVEGSEMADGNWAQANEGRTAAYDPFLKIDPMLAWRESVG
jgi:hypothetical protein